MFGPVAGAVCSQISQIEQESSEPHRPSTIRTVDRIVVLSDGHVVDNGSYTQLLTAGGPFATLVRQCLDKLD